MYASLFVDPQFVGRFIGEGFRTRVYTLKDDFHVNALSGTILDPRDHSADAASYVIKIPKTESLFPPSTARKKFADFSTATAYVDPYIVNPSFIIANGNAYCTIQRKLASFEDVTPLNLPTVREQIDDFFARQRALLRDEGKFLELLGFEGIIRCSQALHSAEVMPRMTNLVIEQTQQGSQLQLHDISVRNTHPPISLAGYVTKRFLYTFERLLIGKGFGIDIGNFPTTKRDHIV